MDNIFLTFYWIFLIFLNLFYQMSKESIQRWQNNFFLRNEKYINNLYMIKEEIIFSKNINKIYAIAKEKNYGLVNLNILNNHFYIN